MSLLAALVGDGVGHVATVALGGLGAVCRAGCIVVGLVRSEAVSLLAALVGDGVGHVAVIALCRLGAVGRAGRVAVGLVVGEAVAVRLTADERLGADVAAILTGLEVDCRVQAIGVGLLGVIANDIDEDMDLQTDLVAAIALIPVSVLVCLVLRAVAVRDGLLQHVIAHGTGLSRGVRCLRTGLMRGTVARCIATAALLPVMGVVGLPDAAVAVSGCLIQHIAANDADLISRAGRLGAGGVSGGIHALAADLTLVPMRRAVAQPLGLRLVLAHGGTAGVTQMVVVVVSAGCQRRAAGVALVVVVVVGAGCQRRAAGVALVVVVAVGTHVFRFLRCVSNGIHGEILCENVDITVFHVHIEGAVCVSMIGFTRFIDFIQPLCIAAMMTNYLDLAAGLVVGGDRNDDLNYARGRGDRSCGGLACCRAVVSDDLLLDLDIQICQFRGGIILGGVVSGRIGKRVLDAVQRRLIDGIVALFLLAFHIHRNGNLLHGTARGVVLLFFLLFLCRFLIQTANHNVGGLAVILNGQVRVDTRLGKLKDKFFVVIDVDQLGLGMLTVRIGVNRNQIVQACFHMRAKSEGSILADHFIKRFGTTLEQNIDLFMIFLTLVINDLDTYREIHLFPLRVKRNALARKRIVVEIPCGSVCFEPADKCKVGILGSRCGGSGKLRTVGQAGQIGGHIEGFLLTLLVRNGNSLACRDGHCRIGACIVKIVTAIAYIIGACRQIFQRCSADGGVAAACDGRHFHLVGQTADRAVLLSQKRFIRLSQHGSRLRCVNNLNGRVVRCLCEDALCGCGEHDLEVARLGDGQDRAVQCALTSGECRVGQCAEAVGRYAGVAVGIDQEELRDIDGRTRVGDVLIVCVDDDGIGICIDHIHRAGQLDAARGGVQTLIFALLDGPGEDIGRTGGRVEGAAECPLDIHVLGCHLVADRDRNIGGQVGQHVRDVGVVRLCAIIMHRIRHMRDLQHALGGVEYSGIQRLGIGAALVGPDVAARESDGHIGRDHQRKSLGIGEAVEGDGGARMEDRHFAVAVGEGAAVHGQDAPVVDRSRGSDQLAVVDDSFAAGVNTDRLQSLKDALFHGQLAADECNSGGYFTLRVDQTTTDRVGHGDIAAVDVEAAAYHLAVQIQREGAALNTVTGHILIQADILDARVVPCRFEGFIERTRGQCAFRGRAPLRFDLGPRCADIEIAGYIIKRLIPAVEAVALVGGVGRCCCRAAVGDGLRVQQLCHGGILPEIDRVGLDQIICRDRCRGGFAVGIGHDDGIGHAGGCCREAVGPYHPALACRAVQREVCAVQKLDFGNGRHIARNVQLAILRAAVCVDIAEIDVRHGHLCLGDAHLGRDIALCIPDLT